MKKKHFYKKLVLRIKSAVKSARIPRSFSRKNNNVFSNEQHIIFQVLMQLESKRLRDMPAFLELLAVELDLPRIPCFSTINKFSLRIKSLFIELLISNLVKSNQRTLIAIDGTGFSLIKRSTYFSTIVGEIKQFIQCVAAADVKRKLITAVRLRRKKRNENIDVNYLMKSTKKQMPVDVFVADKAFDSKKNHDRAERLGAKFIAPVRNMKRGYKVWDHRRRKLVKNFPRETYNKRSVIESIFSAIKRRFGSMVYAKRFKAQKNEVLFRVMAYNMDRLVNNSWRTIYFTQSLSLIKT
jgi:transposase